MTEISYIEQNGEKINIKDAKGRELLETKQNKLIAGNGISISEDGTISAIGGGSSLMLKTLTVKDLVLTSYSGADYTYDANIKYVGNPALLSNSKQYRSIGYTDKSEINDINNGTWRTATDIFSWNGYLINLLGDSGASTENIRAVVDAFSELPDTGEPFLILEQSPECIVTDRTRSDGQDFWDYNVGETYNYYWGRKDVTLFTKAKVDKETLSEDKIDTSHTYNNGDDDEVFSLPATIFYSMLNA
jgi:hypothetical protein